MVIKIFHIRHFLNTASTVVPLEFCTDRFLKNDDTYVANTSHMFLMLAADEQSKSQSPSAPKTSNGRFKSHAFITERNYPTNLLPDFLFDKYTHAISCSALELIVM